MGSAAFCVRRGGNGRAAGPGCQPSFCRRRSLARGSAGRPGTSGPAGRFRFGGFPLQRARRLRLRLSAAVLCDGYGRESGFFPQEIRPGRFHGGAEKGRALPAGGKLLSAYGAGNASAALAWGGSGSRKRKRRRSGTGKTRAFSGRAVPAEERRMKEARERANAFLPPKSLLPEKIPAPESVPGGEKSVSHGRRTVGRMAAKLRGSGSQAVTDVSFCAKRRAGPFLRGIWPPCAARSSRRARR